MKTMTFELAKETTGALRYKEIIDETGEDAKEDPLYLVGDLYLRKAGVAAAQGGSSLWPQVISVAIEIKDGAA